MDAELGQFAATEQGSNFARVGSIVSSHGVPYNARGSLSQHQHQQAAELDVSEPIYDTVTTRTENEPEGDVNVTVNEAVAADEYFHAQLTPEGMLLACAWKYPFSCSHPVA